MSDQPRDPSLAILEPRGRGRPSAREPSVPMTVRVPVSRYDRFAKLAIQQDMAVNELFNELVKLALESRL